MTKIITIKFSGLSGNCYLLKKNNSYILIDTATKSNRKKLENSLIDNGCTIGKLKLIILTHGDFDHVGNTVYLQKKYGCPIAMNREDSIITETGKMFINKKRKIIIADIFTRIFLRIEKFKPDILLNDNDKISKYGIVAKVLHTPGHSAGSISILTKNSDLICGDLFENRRKPKLYFVDDSSQMKSSLEKVKQYNIKMVYPGHGKPFLYSDLQI